MKIIFMFDSLAPDSAREYLIDEFAFLRSRDIDARVLTLATENLREKEWHYMVKKWNMKNPLELKLTYKLKKWSGCFKGAFKKILRIKNK